MSDQGKPVQGGETSETLSQPSTSKNIHPRLRLGLQLGWLDRFFPRNSFLRHTLILAGGNAIAQGFPLLLWPVVARLYSATAIGYYGLYTGFLSVAQVLVTLRYEMAIVSAQDDREAAYLLLLASVPIIPVSLLLIIGLLIVIRAGWLGYGELPPEIVILALPASIFIAGYYTLRYWLIRTNSYKFIAQGTIAQNAGRAILQVVFGLIFRNSWSGMIAGDMLGRVSGLTRMTSGAFARVCNLAFPFDFQYFRHTATKYWKYPVYLLPSSLINAVSIVLPLPLISYYYGTAAAGYFNLALSIVNIPLALVTASVADVFHNRMSTCAHDTPERCLSLFFRMTVITALISIPPAVVGMLLMPQVFTIVLGDRWLIAGQIAVTMIPLVVSQFIVNSVSRVAVIFGQLGLKLIYDIISLITPLLVMVISAQQKMGLIEACWWLNTVNLGTYVLYYFLLIYIMLRFKQQHKVQAQK